MEQEHFPVEAGQIMLFARAIGDPNPIYSDPVYSASTEVASVIAPPTFAQASAHYASREGRRPLPGRRWHGSGKEPTGSNAPPPAQGDSLPSGAAGRMHAEQHFEYHRPLVPGMVLRRESREGKEWERQGRRGGMLRFAETVTEYYDQDDQLVLTTRSVSVRTSVAPMVEESPDAAESE